VLVAFAQWNPGIGYCQGLNFVAAELLHLLDTEEDAFWLLVVIVELLTPSTHAKTMLGLHVDQRVLEHALGSRFPDLYEHMEQLRISMALVSTQWFIALFVNCLPVTIVRRLWDVLFGLAFSGPAATRVIIGAALAVFDVLQAQVLCPPLIQHTNGIPNLIARYHLLFPSYYRQRITLHSFRHCRRTRMVVGSRERGEKNTTRSGSEGTVKVRRAARMDLLMITIRMRVAMGAGRGRVASSAKILLSC
jgi:hypothetical protein